MRDEADRFAAVDTAVLVISFEAARRTRGFCRRLRLPPDWRCLVDERRAAYAAYGMGRNPWWRVFTPGSALRYGLMYLRGERTNRPRGDIFQMGGDFVVDREARLVLAHPNRTPHDRPSVAELLEALRRGRGLSQ